MECRIHESVRSEAMKSVKSRILNVVGFWSFWNLSLAKHIAIHFASCSRKGLKFGRLLSSLGEVLSSFLDVFNVS